LIGEDRVVVRGAQLDRPRALHPEERAGGRSMPAGARLPPVE